MRRFLPFLLMLVAALLIAGCGDDDKKPEKKAGGTTTTDTTATTGEKVEEATITVADGQPKGGPQLIEVKQGDQVRIVVKGAEEEVHLHPPYDIEMEPKGGEDLMFDFTAGTPGSVELELEESGTLLATLQVNP